MTKPYNPRPEWFAEELRDSAMEQLREALSALDAAQNAFLDNWDTEATNGSVELVQARHAATQRALECARIAVRRQDAARLTFAAA